MPDHVATADCERRHKMLTGWNTTILGFMSLLMVIVWSGWCASQTAQSEAIKAQMAASESQQSVDVHAATAEERHSAVTESLARIEATQTRMDDRLDRFFRRNGSDQ